MPRAYGKDLNGDGVAAARDIKAARPYDGGGGRRASCWQRRPQIAFAVCWSDAAWSSSRCDIARFL